jgi:hypothetical protein
MKRYERGTWLCAAALALVLAGCEDEIVEVELPGKDAAADSAKEASPGADGGADATLPEDAADETTPGEDAAAE